MTLNPHENKITWTIFSRIQGHADEHLLRPGGHVLRGQEGVRENKGNGRKFQERKKKSIEKKQEQTLFKRSVAGFGRVLIIWQSKKVQKLK